MERSVYNKRRWRKLPRDECLVDLLLGRAAGPCGGLIHRHHIDPLDPDSRTVPVCASHHPRLHAVLRGLRPAEARRCPHRHTTRESREACERRLNRAA